MNVILPLFSFPTALDFSRVSDWRSWEDHWGSLWTVCSGHSSVVSPRSEGGNGHPGPSVASLRLGSGDVIPRKVGLFSWRISAQSPRDSSWSFKWVYPDSGLGCTELVSPLARARDHQHSGEEREMKIFQTRRIIRNINNSSISPPGPPLHIFVTHFSSKLSPRARRLLCSCMDKWFKSMRTQEPIMPGLHASRGDMWLWHWGQWPLTMFFPRFSPDILPPTSDKCSVSDEHRSCDTTDRFWHETRCQPLPFRGIVFLVIISPRGIIPLSMLSPLSAQHHANVSLSCGLLIGPLTGILTSDWLLVLPHLCCHCLVTRVWCLMPIWPCNVWHCDNPRHRDVTTHSRRGEMRERWSVIAFFVWLGLALTHRIIIKTDPMEENWLWSFTIGRLLTFYGFNHFTKPD